MQRDKMGRSRCCRRFVEMLLENGICVWFNGMVLLKQLNDPKDRVNKKIGN